MTVAAKKVWSFPNLIIALSIKYKHKEENTPSALPNTACLQPIVEERLKYRDVEQTMRDIVRRLLSVVACFGWLLVVADGYPMIVEVEEFSERVSPRSEKKV